MIPVVNPWMLLGAVSIALALFGSGVKVGADLAAAKYLKARQALQDKADQEEKRANQVAAIYGQSLLTSQDTAFELRRRLNETKSNLARCNQADGGVRFTGAFVGLRNDALQSGAGNSIKPTDPPTGAGITADQLIEQDIENGRRWKACRLQLNALIDILEPRQK